MIGRACGECDARQRMSGTAGNGALEAQSRVEMRLIAIQEERFNKYIKKGPNTLGPSILQKSDKFRIEFV